MLAIVRNSFVRAHTRTFITVIHKGYEGWRLFLGTNAKRLTPGIHLNIPILHTLHRMNMMEICYPINKITATTRDNVPITLNADFFYRIQDSEKACFQVADIGKSIISLATSAIRTTIGGMDYDECIKKRGDINARMLTEIMNGCEKWGAIPIKAEIQHIGPLNEGITKILEKQMTAERSRRETELNTRAKVNASEGEKMSQILISEGQKQSIQNKADADRYRVEAEAEALAAAIRLITKETNDPIATMSFLTAQRRYDELNRIATGPNNTVYFNAPESVSSIDLLTRKMK